MNKLITLINNKVFPLGVFISLTAYLVIPDSGKALTIFYAFTLIPALILFPLTFTHLLKDRYFWPLILFLLYLPLTVFWSNNPNAEDLISAVKLSFYIVIFANALKQSSLWLKDYYSYLGFIAAACALTAMLYFYGYSSNPIDERLIAWGDMQNPLWAGTIFSFFAAYFSLALLSKHINRSNRTLFIFSHISLWILIIAALLTQSKGPIIALVLSVLCLSLIIKSKKGVISILIASLIALLFISINYEILSNILNRGASFRVTIWQASIEAIMQNPIIGHGINQSVAIITPDGNLFVSPHNRLLAVLYHGGLVAGVLFILTLVPLFLKQPPDKPHSQFLALLQGLIIFFILCSMSEGRFLITRPNFIWLELWLPLFTYLSILSHNRHSPQLAKN